MVKILDQFKSIKGSITNFSAQKFDRCFKVDVITALSSTQTCFVIQLSVRRKHFLDEKQLKIITDGNLVASEGIRMNDVLKRHAHH